MRQSISKMKNVIFLLFAAYFFIYQNGISPDEALGQEYTVVSSPLAFDAGVDTLMTEREYYSRLQAADEETFKQDFENYFLFLLNTEQKKAYEGLQSLGERKIVIQYYWKAYNPNPLFPENDWLLEFNRRVQYAKKHYRLASPPYVDDRGKYYIKYGEPRLAGFVDPGGLVSLGSYDDDFRIRSRHATPPDLSSNDDPVKKYGGQKKKSISLRNKDDRFSIPYWTLPNETWSYENIQPNFVVYFVRDGASYRQVRSIYDAVTDRHAVRNAIGATDSNLEYFIWRDMIGKRDHISPALARAVLPMRVYETGHPQLALRDRAAELTSHIEMARAKAPSSVRDALQAENRLKFFDRAAQFRGPAGKTRIDVALLVPLKKNLVKKIKKPRKDRLNLTLNVEFSAMLRDEKFEPLVKNQSFSPLAVRLAVREELPYAVGHVSLLAKPQNAELALQVVEKQREKTGYSRRPLQIRDFSSRTKLLLSDIQLHYRVKNEVQKKILPAVHYPDFTVSPYPFHEIRKKEPVLLYFEIYNIQSAGMGESMKISYTISSIKGNKASVDVSFTRPALSDNMHELVEIDLKNVKKGWNRLQVSVSSLQDSTIQAVAQKKISVKE